MSIFLIDWSPIACYFYMVQTLNIMATTIEWLGNASVAVKGPGDRCYINPEEKDLGKKKLTDKSGISLIAYELKEYAGTYQDPHIIATPGEYDIGGFFVLSIRSENAPTKAPNMFVVRYERRTIAFIDGYKGEEMTDADLDTLGTIDLLILPLDEGAKDPVMDIERAVKFVNQIEPGAVIPLERQGAKGAITAFAKELGHEAKPVEELTLKQSDQLGEDETQVIILKKTGE